jgi:2-dehydro-3-deoxyphosphogluconate aldolase / (4S)-4-hydroxy-2-oxoglutarate aldolase
MRSTPSSTLTRTGVMAVLRAPDARLYEPVVRALTEGGVQCIELTLTTPGTIAVLPQLIDAVPEVEIGVGTVLAVAEVAIAAELPFYPGAMTPTEVNTAWGLGASAVKIFPAATVGPGYIPQLAGPYPDVLTLPSGGVALDDIPAWIAAGCVAVSLGGPLLGDAFAGGSLPELRDRAAQALAAVERGRRP